VVLLIPLLRKLIGDKAEALIAVATSLCDVFRGAPRVADFAKTFFTAEITELAETTKLDATSRCRRAFRIGMSSGTLTFSETNRKVANV